jgi:hypothetical protein
MTKPCQYIGKALKHILCGFRDPLWVSRGTFFFLVPRLPSKSGLMNKHIVKHIVKTSGGKGGKTIVEWPCSGSWYPPRSGLIHKHTVKHTGFWGLEVPWYPSKSGLTHKHIVKPTSKSERVHKRIVIRETYREHVEYPCNHNVSHPPKTILGVRYISSRLAHLAFGARDENCQASQESDGKPVTAGRVLTLDERGLLLTRLGKMDEYRYREAPLSTETNVQGTVTQTRTWHSRDERGHARN